MIKTTSNQIVYLAAALACGWLNLVPRAPAQDTGANRIPAPAASTPGQVENTAALTDRPDDERAIRALGKAFARSITAADSKSVAALFSDDAELIDEKGDRVQGRAAIAQLYPSLFQARPGAVVEMAVDSLRFLSPEVAKEEGHTRVNSPGAPETLRRYTVLYVKKDGHWLYSSVREEHSTAVAHHEHLKPLEWLVGDWVDQSSDSTVNASCRWSPDKNFLLRNFTVHVQGRPVMTVNERIGWDPLTRQVKSWVFDSEGGYADALWTRKGSQWVIKSNGVLPDGRAASSTHMLTLTDSNSARWSSIDRTLGDQSITEPADYNMVRQNTAPQANRNP
jgi:uncharacterized protein (TIGR02246 family)